MHTVSDDDCNNATTLSLAVDGSAVWLDFWTLPGFWPPCWIPRTGAVEWQGLMDMVWRQSAKQDCGKIDAWLRRHVCRPSACLAGQLPPFFPMPDLCLACMQIKVWMEVLTHRLKLAAWQCRVWHSDGAERGVRCKASSLTCTDAAARQTYLVWWPNAVIDNVIDIASFCVQLNQLHVWVAFQYFLHHHKHILSTWHKVKLCIAMNLIYASVLMNWLHMAPGKTDLPQLWFWREFTI